MFYKANTRNAILLENHLRSRGADNIRKQGLPHQPDLSLGDGMEEEEAVVTTQPIAEPEPVLGGFFGTRKQREPDLEAQRPEDSHRSKRSRHADEPSKHSKSKKTMRGANEGSGRTGGQESGVVRGTR